MREYISGVLLKNNDNSVAKNVLTFNAEMTSYLTFREVGKRIG
jgi:hypothetical protein